MYTIKMPLISVIVPIYNVEKYLNKCINSIVNQTYKNLEIILVDDGSTDKSVEYCEMWKSKDDRISVIHKINGGLSDARNTGIELASGDYISFIDSDDYIELNMYEIMIKSALEEDADLVCCGRYIVNDVIKTKAHYLDKKKIYTSKEALKQILIAGDIEEAAWDKLYRINLFDDIRYPVGEINEDIVVIPFILNKCNKIVHVAVPLYNYRSTPNSITNSTYNEKKHVYLKHISEINDFIMKYYPEMKKDLIYFKGRYSYAILLDLLINIDINKLYFKEYKKYLKIFRKSYFYMLFTKRFNKKNKIQGFLIFCELYGVIYKVKKKYL